MSALTPRQSELLAVVDHYCTAIGEPAPAAYVARTLGVSHERVRAMMRSLFDLGWLRGPSTPAMLSRSLPLQSIQRDTSAEIADDPSMTEAARQSSLLPALLKPGFVEMAPLALRASVQSINLEDRTVELVFTTGAAVERYDYSSGQRYMETLSLQPGHVRLDRLNAGVSLLDGHESGSVRKNRLGMTIPGSAVISKGQGRVMARFSQRADVESVWQDIRDGMPPPVSVGYKVHKYETTPATEGAPMLARAVDWEPYEVSLVTIPADYGARIRSSNAETYQCEIVTRSEAVEAEPEQPEPVEVPTDQPAETAEEEKPMADQSKFVVEEDEIPTRKAPAAPSESEIITARETERCEGIFNGCRAAKIPSDYAMELISKKVDLSTARGMILDEMAKRGGDRVGGEAPGRVDVTGEDPLVHKRASIENAILHRAAPDLKGPDGKQLFPLSDEGKEYRGMSLLDIARTFLRARGVRVNHMSKMELAGAALGYRSDGMHTTSDFPLLLADVTNKVLRAAYEVAPQTYSAFTRNVSLPDFKSSKQLQVGEAPGLDEIREHGEYTSGTITESKEEFALKTWGKKFSITRTALINDDLSAFSRVPVQFGQSARNKESDIVWAIITANAALSDGVTLFYATTHVNLAGSATAISVDAIGLGRAAMRKQKGLDGVTVLNLNPRFLVVPAAKETIADQFVSTALMAYGSAQVNPFAGRLQVIAEPRLDANSATAWYLFASPDQIDMVLTATLEGQTGPVVESRVGFDIDGIEIKCRHDFNAKAVDYRGMYKNAGA